VGPGVGDGVGSAFEGAGLVLGCAVAGVAPGVGPGVGDGVGSAFEGAGLVLGCAVAGVGAGVGARVAGAGPVVGPGVGLDVGPGVGRGVGPAVGGSGVGPGVGPAVTLTSARSVQDTVVPSSSNPYATTTLLLTSPTLPVISAVNSQVYSSPGGSSCASEQVPWLSRLP
jgi:hypothetical protein